MVHAMQSCVMNAKSSIIPKLPMGMVTLEMGKTNRSGLGLHVFLIRNWFITN